MSRRTEIERLRRLAEDQALRSDVQAISDLMDELAAEAAGCGGARPVLHLVDLFTDDGGTPGAEKPTP
jgi:hypothetical protein